MTIIRSECPVIRDEQMELYEPVTIGGEATRVTFTKRILWLRESEAQIVLRHDGVMIEERATFGDMYGFLRGVESALKDDEIPYYEKRLHIAPGDKLKVELDVQFFDTPVLPPDVVSPPTQLRQYQSLDGFRWGVVSTGMPLQQLPLSDPHTVYRTGDSLDRVAEWVEARRAVSTRMVAELEAELAGLKARSVGEWTPFDPSDRATWPKENTRYLIQRAGAPLQPEFRTWTFLDAGVQFWIKENIVAYCLPRPYQPPQPDTVTDCSCARCGKMVEDGVTAGQLEPAVQSVLDEAGIDPASVTSIRTEVRYPCNGCGKCVNKVPGVSCTACTIGPMGVMGGPKP